MITTLKLMVAGLLGWAILNPGSLLPPMNACECEADVDSKLVQPRAEDCECKADALSRPAQPRAEDCECKADA